MLDSKKVGGKRNSILSEDIVKAYQETGSVWKAGKKLGINGQDVHYRLKSLGYKLHASKWSSEELTELKALVDNGATIGEIAIKLNRPYAGVAMKLSRMRIKVINKNVRKPKRGKGLTKAKIMGFIKKVEESNLNIKQLAAQERFTISGLVNAIQHYAPEWWKGYVSSHSNLQVQQCKYCGNEFIPITKKQEYCSNKCCADKGRDDKYYGGKRRTAIGLGKNQCQLCGKTVKKWLSVHHVFGKENDPDDEVLIAICRGCHDILTRLARQPWVEDEYIVLNLLSLVFLRRGKNINIDLQFEELTQERLKELEDDGEEVITKYPEFGT